jgi:phosphoglycolate phosphatase-like HAD superfamily hydrolase
MAKNAKVNVVALTQGAHSRDELEKSEPTLILDHIAQLYERINPNTR